MPAWNIKPGQGGVQQLDAVQVPGAGSVLFGIYTGVVTVDVASITAATVAETSVTITGVRVGDIVAIVGPDAGPSVAVGILQCYVSGNDTVKMRVVNPSAGALDPASASFRYLWFDFTE